MACSAVRRVKDSEPSESREVRRGGCGAAGKGIRVFGVPGGGRGGWARVVVAAPRDVGGMVVAYGMVEWLGAVRCGGQEGGRGRVRRSAVRVGGGWDAPRCGAGAVVAACEGGENGVRRSAAWSAR